MKREYTCEFCEIKFTDRADRPRRFCSNSCNINFKNKFPKRATVFCCTYCGKEFIRNVYPSLIDKNKFEFCSPTCRNKARALTLIPCPVCGKLFSPRYSKNKDRVRKFCSQPCSNSLLKGRKSTNPKTHTDYEKEFTKKHYPEMGAGWVSEKLGHTKGSIVSLANKLKIKLTGDARKRIMRDATSDSMTNNNPMKNPETAKKVGIKTSERYRNDEDYRVRFLKSKANSNKKKMTKPELLCKKILEEVGINAEYQVEIKSRFIVDFRIGSTILQVDGEYWHGHPRFEPLTERQTAQRKRDAAQDKYLSACGYKVIRIWEKSITKENIINLLLG